MKNIVITGVSSGIGYGAAKELINRGYMVFGSVRRQDDADTLKDEFGKSFTPLVFDITDHEAIRKAARQVENEIDGKGLAGLFNNAGMAEGFPLMHMPIEMFQKHLDVLVTGQLVVTQAFLPLLGAKKNYPNKPGRILNISSINGKMPTPLLGAYVASKHALEGLSSTLRIELMQYAIEVIVIGAGMIKTAIWDKQPKDYQETLKNTDYHKSAKRIMAFFDKAIPSQAMELHVFSKKIIDIFEKRNPKSRYTILKNKFKNWTIPMMLSTKALNQFYAKLMGLKK